MDLFSMQGRYNRAKYFWVVLAIVLVGQLVSTGVGMAVSHFVSDPETAFVTSLTIGLIVAIGIAVVAAFQAVKRLHDMDRPGTHYWLLLIPIYNIYFGLVLLFKKGTEGENKYGPDPLAGK